MVGDNALIEAVAVVVGVQLRRRLSIVLNCASSDLAAVADRRPVVPVKGFAHAEIRGEVMIHPELDVASIQ